MPTNAQVEGMFLQLITAGLIGADVVDGVLKWIVCREAKKCKYPPHCWQNDKYWNGINLFPESHKWRYKLVKQIIQFLQIFTLRKTQNRDS